MIRVLSMQKKYVTAACSALCKQAGIEFQHVNIPATSKLSATAYRKIYGDDIDFPAAAVSQAFRSRRAREIRYLFPNSVHYRRLHAVAASIDLVLHTRQPDVVICKPFINDSAQILFCKALTKKIPILCIEDGAVSNRALILDPHPPYMAADRNWLFGKKHLNAEQKQRAAAFLQSWRALQASKYLQIENKNELQRLQKFVRKDSRPVSFLALQVPFDMSVFSNLPPAFGSDYWQWLETVLRSIPQAWKLIIKMHPKVIHRRLPKAIHQHLHGQENFLLIKGVGIHTLFNASHCTITLSSNVGMESALFGCPVIVSGRPVYSGQNISIDLDPDVEIQHSLPAALEAALSFSPKPADLELFVSRFALDYHLWPGETQKLLDRIELARKYPPIFSDIRRPLFEQLPSHFGRWCDTVQSLSAFNDGCPPLFGPAWLWKYLSRRIRKRATRISYP